MNLPKDKQKTFDNIVADLKSIDHVVAVVLGGSFATGKATENSDLDIGIYYNGNQPFHITAVKSVAEKYATDQAPTVTDFYQWGPWVNGGAWLQTESGKVDFLYRNLDQVTNTIENAQNGKWDNHYEQQPPYGFSSVIYLAEIESCIPAYDKENTISKLKSAIKNYPAKLKQTIIQEALWSAEFTILNADGFAQKEDYYNTFGCITRALKSIVNALFAINEKYPIGDKKAIEILTYETYVPKDFHSRVNSILIANKNSLTHNLEALKALFQDAVRSTNGNYKPLYRF
ncbi:nucleotidyltransferase domain-containing protein [Pedobacter sp. V48]|uniref:nucleotidyltransferase domain-containing protein n=1 Tax=Pedobacter sp. V48 TaxID=509635 RepID=UPI0004B99747|nr:nucleotidyltransferase domain-containing protein [Pedobacter sp. V48]